MAKRVHIPEGEYLKGMTALSDRLSGTLSGLEDLTEEGMLKVVTDIRQRAAERAPKDTGTLRGTATETVAGLFDQVIGTVRFPEEYAADQHEHIEYHHDDGEAKYLEKAMNEKANQIREQMADALKKLFGGG